jgi:hypothetical protein
MTSTGIFGKQLIPLKGNDNNKTQSCILEISYCKRDVNCVLKSSTTIVNMLRKKMLGSDKRLVLTPSVHNYDNVVFKEKITLDFAKKNKT